MSQTHTLLVDDQDSQIQYLCGSLKEYVATGSYYNNTWTTVTGGGCGNGWFDYTFYGTGVYVAASAAAPGANYSVKIDNGEFLPQSGNGAYDSPTLSDGKHTIIYALESNGKSLPAFDYLTITPGASTLIKGQILAVDDTDDSIVYSGSWKNTPSVPLSFDYSNSPHRATTQWSSNVGDSLQFRFEGSSISVFGIATNISLGNITANYTVDGVSKVQGLPQGTLDSLPMVNLFHADVQPGAHTLTINITAIRAPQTLGIDLITYNASFNSISSLSSASKSDALKVGSKVGIAFGVLACVALLAASVVFWGRRRKSPRVPLYHRLDGADKLLPYSPFRPPRRA